MDGKRAKLIYSVQEMRAVVGSRDEARDDQLAGRGLFAH
jgi:hypothetical protein